MEMLILNPEKLPVNIIIAVFFLLVMSIFLLLFFYFSRKTINQKELEKKDLELYHQKKLLEANFLVQEKERKRIGGEMHDDISSQLNLIALDIQLLNKPGLSVEKLWEIKDRVMDVVAKVHENSRKIAHNLFPPILEKFGLKAALEEICDDYNFSNSIRIDLSCRNDFDQLTYHRQLHVYRIFQELINNSLRHGKASLIQIDIVHLADRIAFNYCDNGKGFDTEKIKNPSGGLGLKNIENRIFFMKGEFSLNSKPGVGIYIHFSVPL